MVLHQPGFGPVDVDKDVDVSTQHQEQRYTDQPNGQEQGVRIAGATVPDTLKVNTSKNVWVASVNQFTPLKWCKVWMTETNI